MDARLEMFEAIKELVEEQIPEIKHFDMWNENVVYAEQDEAYPLPALFLEFGKIEWNPVKNGTFQGQRLDAMSVGFGPVRFHLVTEWGEGSYHQGFALLGKLLQAMIENDTHDVSWKISYPNASYTNHSHMELLENIEEVKAKYVRSY